MWTISERYSCWAIVDETGRDVFYVDKQGQADHGSVTSRGCTAEELADRAALCAAGPEMLQALKLAEEELQFDKERATYSNEPREVDQALRVVRAAIAKAKTRPID